ncbi:uncharacterized protein TNCT_244101 [Trichonephila clavata]|uniref:Uncharacterized protein n=1 Tax=Trichonephila clavata TaxID=2740835 RepID=A0A8X6KM87_TRICU|nr:uncharacterized protein TNCT_244101 [Trichonephila clavata]
MNEMYLIFTILCLLLLLFNLEPIPGRPTHKHYAMIWMWKDFRVVRILPSDWYVLVDNQLVYLYVQTNSLDTYIPAIRLDTQREHYLLHYNYLLDWIKEPAIIVPYPTHIKNVIEILNHLTKSL